MRNTTSQPYNPMSHLAECLGLAHDGGDDSRLFLDDMPYHIETLNLTRKEYQDMEKDINSFSINGDGFDVHAWNDASGYDYWTLGQEENNYISITLNVTDPLNIDIRQAKIAIQEAIKHFRKYGRYI